MRTYCRTHVMCIGSQTEQHMVAGMKEYGGLIEMNKDYAEVICY